LIRLFTSGESKNHFKCFYCDIGLLNAQLNITYQEITKDKLNYYKGAITENFIAGELHQLVHHDLLSWSQDNYEIEFIMHKDGRFIPIEMKSSKRSRASVSLEKYIDKYRPPLAYKISPRNFGLSSGYYSIPIYFISKIGQ